MEDEKKSVEAANALLQQDLEALTNKKKIAEEERDRMVQQVNRLQDQVRDHTHAGSCDFVV